MKDACPNLGPIRKGCWLLSWLKNIKRRQSASLSGLGQEAEADTVTRPAVDQGRLQPLPTAGSRETGQ